MKIIPSLIFAALVTSSCASGPKELKAFRDNDVNKINALIEGRNLNSAFIEGYSSKYPSSPLQAATYLGTLSQVKSLVAAGADVNYINPHTGRNALFSAITGAKTSSLKYLLESGSQTDVVDKWGYTPLGHAIKYEKDSFATILRNHGAQFDGTAKLALKDRQKKANKASGFNFGKALALGAGTIIGGGSGLSTDQQAVILGGIIADSMGNTTGTSNFNGAVSSMIKPGITISPSSQSFSNSNEPTNGKATDDYAKSSVSASANTSAATSQNSPSSSIASANQDTRTKYYFSICREEFPKYQKRLGVISSIKNFTYPAGRNDIYQDQGRAAAKEYGQQVALWNEVTFERRVCSSPLSNTLEDSQTVRREFINKFNASGRAIEYK